MVQSILWGPADAAAPEPLVQPYPIFLQQQALRQVVIHTRSAPAKALLGFLLGELCQCPESGVRYLLIDQGLRVGAEVPGDHTSALLAKVWPRLQEQLATLNRQVVGWYHTHTAAGSAFSREDVGTQLMYFAQPWQVGLVLGMEGGKPAAGWFRVSQAEDWSSVRLPFYEVLSPDSIDPSGKKRSHIDWANFKPYKAVPPARKAPAAAPAARPSVTAVSPAQRRVGPPPRPGVTQATAPAAAPVAPPRPAAPPPRPAPAPPRPAAAPPPPPPRTPTAPTFRPPARPPAPPPEPEEEPVAAEEEPVAEEEAAPEEPPVAQAEPAVREEEEEEPVPEAPRPRTPPPPAYAAVVRRPSRASMPAFTERKEEPQAKGAPRWQVYAAGSAGAVAVLVLVVAGWALGLVHFGRAPASAPTSAQNAPAPATPAQRAPAQPAAPAEDPALVVLDRITDSLTSAVRSYRDRKAAFDGGQKNCAPLANALTGVENLWMAYNTRGKPRGVVLDAQRAARDQSLYAQVDTVESHFDASACPRP